MKWGLLVAAFILVFFGALLFFSKRGVADLPTKATSPEKLKARHLPGDLLFTNETTFRLTEDTYLEPDFVFYPQAGGRVGLSAANAVLVVELADSSLGYDLGRKAALYAAFGIRELWVIDAVKLTAHIHRDPAPAGYGSVVTIAPDRRLVPQDAPGLAVTLADLDLR